MCQLKPSSVTGSLALFDAVIAYKADRLSRGEDTDWSRIETWAADHGKTLVLVDSSTCIRYPARDDSDRWQWMSAKTQAGKEWNGIRERIIRSTCRIMRDGYWVGRSLFGYAIEGDRCRKTLVPAATADPPSTPARPRASHSRRSPIG
jgi:DNA invertase Pin-like site-specific DNA recombinase